MKLTALDPGFFLNENDGPLDATHEGETSLDQDVASFAAFLGLVPQGERVISAQDPDLKDQTGVPTKAPKEIAQDESAFSKAPHSSMLRVDAKLPEPMHEKVVLAQPTLESMAQRSVLEQSGNFTAPPQDSLPLSVPEHPSLLVQDPALKKSLDKPVFLNPTLPADLMKFEGPEDSGLGKDSSFLKEALPFKTPSEQRLTPSIHLPLTHFSVTNSEFQSEERKLPVIPGSPLSLDDSLVEETLAREPVIIKGEVPKSQSVQFRIPSLQMHAPKKFVQDAINRVHQEEAQVFSKFSQAQPELLPGAATMVPVMGFTPEEWMDAPDASEDSKETELLLDIKAPVIPQVETSGSLQRSHAPVSVATEVSTPEALKEAVLGFISHPGPMQSMRIRLRPDALGEILVEVSSRGKEVSVEIQTATEEAKSLVQEGMKLLQEALNAKSLVLASANVRTHSEWAPGQPVAFEGQQASFSDHPSRKEPDFEAWQEVVHQARDRAYVNGLRGRGGWNGFEQQLDLRV